jgi:hypothetical protein
VLDEVGEHVKSFWTDRHAIAIAPEKVVLRIQTERLKDFMDLPLPPCTAQPRKQPGHLPLSVTFGVIWRLGKPGSSCLTVSVTTIQRGQDGDVTTQSRFLS